MLIGTMAGCTGYRSVSRFCQAHAAYLSKSLGFKHGLPSHVSLTAIVSGVSLESFESALRNWSLSRLDYRAPAVISVDGKAIKSSVVQGLNQSQNFVSVVSAFCASQGLVVGCVSYENKYGSEIEVVRQVIEVLGLKGAVFTLDAAHDSKKRWI